MNRVRQPTARQGIFPGLRPLFSFNERYAAIYRRNDSHLILSSSSSIRPKKGLNFRQTPFFLFWSSLSTRPKTGLNFFFFWSEDLFFFWSSPSNRPKGRNFWRRPFVFGSLEWGRPAGTLLGLNVAH